MASKVSSKCSSASLRSSWRMYSRRSGLRECQASDSVRSCGLPRSDNSESCSGVGVLVALCRDLTSWEKCSSIGGQETDLAGELDRVDEILQIDVDDQGHEDHETDGVGQPLMLRGEAAAERGFDADEQQPPAIKGRDRGQGGKGQPG